jgi:hypothetical protein
LEADCFAAASLARTNAAAVSAAVRYFSRLGPFRYDTDHPTGAQRAAKILACLPSPQTLRPDIAPKEPPAEPALSGFSVTTKTLVNGGLGRDVSIWVAGKLVGTLSNRRQPMKLEVQGMPAGTYPYRIAVNLYALDDMLQFNPSGTVLGDGELTIRGGETFAVELAPGSSPVLILEQ